MVGLIPAGIARSRGFYSYKIDHALRLNAADNADLERLGPNDGSELDQGSVSLWIKRAALGSNMYLFYFLNSSGNDGRWFLHLENDVLKLRHYNGSNYTSELYTNALFRDPSSWLHILAVWDAANATSTERHRLYINGERVSDFSTETYPAQNVTMEQNRDDQTRFGDRQANDRHFDGYFAEIVSAPGIAASPTDFGQFKNGVWVPKQYTGSYGTNGFHLNFSDAANIGKDVSGNGNDFTANNITSDDQVEDTPTHNGITYSDLVVGVTLEEAGLKQVAASALTWIFHTTALPNTGTWYWEVEMTTDSNSGNNGYPFIGISYSYDVQGDRGFPGDVKNGANPGVSLEFTGVFNDNGNSFDLFDPHLTDGDIVQYAIDMDSRKGWIGVNGNWFDSTANQSKTADSGDPDNGNNHTFTIPTGVPVWPADNGGNGSVTRVFHGSEINYTPPTGFKPLNAANLPKPEIIQGSKYFNAVTYTGNGGTQSITGVGFKPDLVWVKNRDQLDNHVLVDSVRGTGKVLSSNTNTAESSDNNTVTSFDIDGFSLGADVKVNTNGENYVAWCWKKGFTPGFDIVGYTGNGVAGRTISHSLGQVPAMMIVKNRDNTSTNWFMYHQGVNDIDPETDYMTLNTVATVTDSPGVWNDTKPTANDFTVGSVVNVNGNNDRHIAYLFAEVPGFSRFGSYTGNGSANGPFVWCGFKPAFLIYKRINNGNNWGLVDSTRSQYNPVNDRIEPHDNDAEDNLQANFDFVANGFKVRTYNSAVNSNGSRHIFLAFAEHPFKFSNAR